MKIIFFSSPFWSKFSTPPLALASREKTCSVKANSAPHAK